MFITESDAGIRLGVGIGLGLGIPLIILTILLLSILIVYQKLKMKQGIQILIYVTIQECWQSFIKLSAGPGGGGGFKSTPFLILAWYTLGKHTKKHVIAY